jgi:hypothetical protein
MFLRIVCDIAIGKEYSATVGPNHGRCHWDDISVEDSSDGDREGGDRAMDGQPSSWKPGQYEYIRPLVSGINL